MKFVKAVFGLLLAVASTAVSSQQYQTQNAPLFAANAKYANGVSPGYAISVNSGLVINVGQGTAFCGNSPVIYGPNGTLTLTNNAINYVYLDINSGCAPAKNTSGFSDSTIPLATIVTSGGSVSSIFDDRTFFASYNRGTTTGELTANSSGGAAPGATFNGSTPVTFDYHSFGAAGIN